jgi:hypothetical protein
MYRKCLIYAYTHRQMRFEVVGEPHGSLRVIGDNLRNVLRAGKGTYRCNRHAEKLSEKWWLKKNHFYTKTKQKIGVFSEFF